MTKQGKFQVTPILDSNIAKLANFNSTHSLIHLQVKNCNGACITATEIHLHTAIMELVKKDLQGIDGLWAYFLPSLKPNTEKIFCEDSVIFEGKFHYRFVLGSKILAQLVSKKDLWSGYPFHPR